MKCPEARRFLDPFLDGELTVPENMKVLEHLNICRACSEIFKGEEALRAKLKAELGSEHAPEGLRVRLSRALANRGRAPRRRWGMMAAAAFFVTLVGALLFLPSGEYPQAMASEMVSRHETMRKPYHGTQDSNEVCLCRTCTPNSPETFQRFFAEHGQPDVCSHDLGKLGYELLGAAVWQRRGRLVCWTTQRDAQGRVISHALVSNRVKMDKEMEVLKASGRTVVFAPRGNSGMT